MKNTLIQRCVAELIGAFALVFIGCTTRAMVGDTTNFAGILVVHLSFALTVAAMIYTLSHISAAVFNPALTLGFAVAGRFPWRYVLPYWLAQFVGAIIAVALDLLILPQKAPAVHFGATQPKAGILSALIIEVILTFLLMLVNMAAATDKRFKRSDSGLTVGFVILVSGLMGNSLSGASMNPARSLAPALFAGGSSLANVWLYFLGPFVGAMMAVAVYQAIRGGDGNAKDVLEEVPGKKEKHPEQSKPEKVKEVTHSVTDK
ncbi:MAG TPA: aquaporin [Ktedonobacteraceae bacterium]|nr:aquaporin [Ktedonobacteraceae bacterium]